MVQITHRQSKKLPSLRKHGFSALLLLGIVMLSIITWGQISGRRVNIPVQSGPEFTLNAPKPPKENIMEVLPDLLADDNIPLTINPTDPVEMIGGPTPTLNVTDNKGPRPPTQRDIGKVIQSSTTPKTILINGQPLGGNANTTHTSTPLIRAPIQGLTRMSPFGLVPTPTDDGRNVLTSYAKPFTAKPYISYTSLVIGGLGINESLTLRAIDELPGEVSLAFAAHAPNLQIWVHRARSHGHEVLLELPMEDKNFVQSKAKHVLNTSATESDSIRDVDYLLSRAQGYFAVTNYGGEVIFKNEQKLKPILEHIKNAGLGFVYDSSIKGARIQPLGTRISLPVVSANTLLDSATHDRASVQKTITNLAKDKSQTIPIGMGFSYDGTIDGIKDWLATKPSNIALAPVSYALKTNK
ncbi:MAG: hypothetical protein COA43_12020 [Robiginitomaculum sp.]|nr:MAG: hypothetical protein COA43_12020 [Robiginitomaculum sp.]